MKPDQILASLSQLDHQKRPVTLVAIAFFSLVCLSLAAMQGWSIYQAREQQLAAADAATVAMSRALAERIGTLLGSTDTLLADLAERVETEADSGAGARLARHLEQRLQGSGALAALAVLDDTGTVVTAAGPAAPAGALAEALGHHGADAGSALYIGKPWWDATGKIWLLPLSRRVTRPDGSYGGLALASLRLSALQKFADACAVGPHGSITVALDNGALLAGRAYAGPGIGPNAGRRNAYATGRHGGAANLFSYQHLDGYPVLLMVSRPADDVLREWWDSAYLSTLGAALLLLLQLWMGIRLYSQIALRDRLEKERRMLQKLLVKKSRSLRHQAHKDALTGIANRRQLDIRLAREFNRAVNEGRSLALVILDVDYFKNYNDRYGHPAGDECLKFVAGCVNSGRRRSEDLAARLGGEEFAILLPDTGLRGAIAVAEAIRKQVASQRLVHIAGTPHSVTVSCGVHALVPVEGMAPQDLLEAADRALYLAKTSGRNRVRAEGTVPPLRTRRFSLVINK